MIKERFKISLANATQVLQYLKPTREAVERFKISLANAIQVLQYLKPAREAVVRFIHLVSEAGL